MPFLCGIASVRNLDRSTRQSVQARRVRNNKGELFQELIDNFLRPVNCRPHGESYMFS
jgi:hypothetical protein